MYHNFVSDFVVLPEEPGRGVGEHQPPPGLRDLLLGQVQAQGATPAAQLVLAIRTAHINCGFFAVSFLVLFSYLLIDIVQV